MGLNENLREQREKQKKAIPSKVFYNHFFALNYHIISDSNKYNLKTIPFYNSLKLRNENFNIDTIRKLLWNSWSTEFAFNLGNQINNAEYYKFALHWNFPQAYYSVYLTMTAFHETQGIANEQHEKSIKLFGNSVKDNHYPAALGFHVLGHYEAFQFKGLSTFNKFPKDCTGLSRIASLDEAQTQIAMFLKSTRIKNAEHKREKLADAKDKKFINNKGEFRKKFSKEHWDIVYQTIPVTTLLNLLYRLRIKANYHDVESFIHADINFKIFHESLGGIIDYINFVHEAYIVKVIGNKEYENILNKFPNKLNRETALKRYNDFIK
jgi:hypothetical protein